MSYLPCEPQQQALLPQALQDWLPEGHLAYFVSDSIDSLDLQAFYARSRTYSGSVSQHARAAPSASRVEARMHGIEPSADGDAERL